MNEFSAVNCNQTKWSTEEKASNLPWKEYHDNDHDDDDSDDNEDCSLWKPLGTNTNSMAPFCHSALSKSSFPKNTKMWKPSNILEKDTRKTHQQEFARIDLCFSISTWLKSCFTDILRDVKNSTIFGHFLEMRLSTVSRWLFFCAGPECLTGASFTAIRVEPKIREGKRRDFSGDVNKGMMSWWFKVT